MADRPGVEEVRGWLGSRLDEISGARAGKVEGAYVDPRTGSPEWLLIRVGRFGDHRCVPTGDAVAGARRVWVPWDRATIRGSPKVRPDVPLSAVDELRLCSHYRLPPSAGRPMELLAAPPNAPSVVPLEYVAPPD
jgi:PRC-barrel domain